jgi:hypothetical protein
MPNTPSVFFHRFGPLTRAVSVLVLSAALTLPLLANAQVNKNLAPGFTSIPAGSKIVLMPIDVELFSISAGGVTEPKADWTSNAAKHMRLALQERKRNLGLPFTEVTESDADAFHELSSLQAAVAGSIAIHHVGPIALPTKEGKLDWSIGDAVDELRKKTEADYGLFVWVRDTYASPERKAMMIGMALLGVGIAGGIQVGYASLVDLKTGQVMWFNRLISSSGDLRDIEPAKKSIEALMSAFPPVSK